MLRYQFEDADDRDRFLDSLRDRGVNAAAIGVTEAGVSPRHEEIADDEFRTMLDLLAPSEETVMPRPDGRLVSVHVTADRIEADRIADELRMHGIGAAVLGGIDHTTIAAGSSVTAHSVQVHEDDLAEAMSFIEEARPAMARPSSRVAQRTRSASLLFAAVMTLGWLGSRGIPVLALVVVVAVDYARRPRSKE
ncbi:MAG: hypothetical protein ACI8Y4_001353 [Candidatus Poriferisodalaceae bacterium]|jgi:hypothetical protein